jgi:hypothetical protein
MIEMTGSEGRQMNLDDEPNDTTSHVTFKNVLSPVNNRIALNNNRNRNRV